MYIVILYINFIYLIVMDIDVLNIGISRLPRGFLWSETRW